MSLRARLLALVLLATLLPALLLGGRFFLERDAEMAAAVKSLSTAADNAGADLEHRVQGTAQLHFGLAYAGLLDSPDRAACSAYLVFGEGFLAASVRTLTAGMALVTRSPHPIKVFSDTQVCASWVATFAELAASEVNVALNQARGAAR